MKAIVLIFSLVFASAVHAQSVTVTSGEHDGFSRLVLTFPRLPQWSLVREDKGYRLAVEGTSLVYDLSDVYRRLTTDRVENIEVDSVSGGLRLTLNCRCFAMPFELRQGILVIDITDGVAPEGSVFELAADKTMMPPLGAAVSQNTSREPEPKPEVQPGPAMALVDAIGDAARLPQTETLPESLKAGPSLERTRDELLWQLSKGAAAGVVDVVDKLKPEANTHGGTDKGDQIRVGSQPGIDPNTTRRTTKQMTAEGDHCIADDRLDLAEWGEEVNLLSDFALKTTGLVGEFDHPDTEAIVRSVRYYLSLGFGAEARLLLEGMKTTHPDQALWVAISHIVDLEIPASDVFEGMDVCDGNAALWSVLAKAELPADKELGVSGLLRAFSALPLHLRRHLGPGLANRFLAKDDAETARAIRDAILRAAGEPGPSTKLMEAEIDLANGKTSSAETILEPLAGEASPVGIMSTIALIETQVNDGREVQPALTVAAEALLHQAKGGDEAAGLRKALALAYASQNRFDEAFQTIPSISAESPDLWNILAERGNDSNLLSWAILQKSADMPSLPPATKRLLARRLLDMNFPDQALLWLSPQENSNGAATNLELLMRAEGHLLQNNNMAALAELDGLTEDAAQSLRAKALFNLQDDQAIQQLSEVGQTEDAQRLARQLGNWKDVATLESDGIWKQASALMEPPASSELAQTADQPVAPKLETDGPLAQSRAALEASSKTRAVLDLLLADQVIPELMN